MKPFSPQLMVRSFKVKVLPGAGWREDTNDTNEKKKKMLQNGLVGQAALDC